MAKTKAKLEDFIRVVVVERDKYPTVDAAAKALGLTKASFSQRLVKERKRYPEVFKSVPRYPRPKTGPRTPSQEEALAILKRLQG